MIFLPSAITGKGVKEMKHALRISFGIDPGSGRIASVRRVSVRERLLRLLLGDTMKLTVIVPGNSVEELSVREIPERSGRCERSATA